MSERQVIWLRDGVTSFTCLCEECLAARRTEAGRLAYRAAKVAGRLSARADVGWTRCHRGHSIAIRRVGRTAA